jgi:hypothetical protein
MKPEGARVYVSQRQAGVTVNPDTATTYSAVNGCVRLISETLASLPWHVYRKAPTGRIAEPGHGVQWLLNMQPNPEQTAYVFRRQLLSNYLLWGNGYAEIQQGLDGRAVWLWPLPPDRRAKEEAEASKLLDDALALQEAGCFALVLEKIPATLAAKVTAALRIPTIGIGAGADVDGQVLVLHDMLGMNTEFNPRFLRRYAQLGELIPAAIRQYVQDVRAKDFPNDQERY